MRNVISVKDHQIFLIVHMWGVEEALCSFPMQKISILKSKMAALRNVIIVKNHKIFVKFYVWGFEEALSSFPRPKIFNIEIQDSGSARCHSC